MTQVTIFTRPKCAYCPMVKKFLDAKGITYIEVEAENDNQTYIEAADKANSYSVPLTTYKDSYITGWDSSKLMDLAREWEADNG